MEWLGKGVRRRNMEETKFDAQTDLPQLMQLAGRHWLLLKSHSERRQLTQHE